MTSLLTEFSRGSGQVASNKVNLIIKKWLRKLKDFSHNAEQLGNASWFRIVSVLFAIYVVALLPLIRANYSYIDDIGRIARGYDGWDNFSRFLSTFLSHIIHTTDYLSDISPLTQLLAIVFMVIASSIVLHEFSYGKCPSLWSLAALVPLGLNPYFLECLSYKFDSPYMALSILVSVLPLLFRRCQPFYFISSVLCSVAMCMTYQASSGVFPMAVILLSFLEWLQGERPDTTFKFIITSAISFLLGILIFKMFIMVPVDDYVSNGMASPFEVVSHYRTYFSLVISDFKTGWLIVSAALAALFVISSVLFGDRGIVVTAFISAIVLAMLFSLCFGLYPFLSQPSFNPRGMYGFGVCIGLIATATVALGSERWIARAIIFVLAWSFISFAATYGNALTLQTDWEDFRREEVLNDLTDLEQFREEGTKYIQIAGSVGRAEPINNIAQGTGILSRLIPVTFREEWVWGYDKLASYYGLEDCIFDLGQAVDDYSDFTLLHESYYHKIYEQGGHFIIELK